MTSRWLLTLCFLTLAVTGLALTAPVEIEADEVCAYINEDPCPSTNDCGYEVVGSCCRPRCDRPLWQCPRICFPIGSSEASS